jgi:hypothetical protein
MSTRARRRRRVDGRRTGGSSGRAPRCRPKVGRSTRDTGPFALDHRCRYPSPLCWCSQRLQLPFTASRWLAEVAGPKNHAVNARCRAARSRRLPQVLVERLRGERAYEVRSVGVVHDQERLRDRVDGEGLGDRAVSVGDGLLGPAARTQLGFEARPWRRGPRHVRRCRSTSPRTAAPGRRGAHTDARNPRPSRSVRPPPRHRHSPPRTRRCVAARKGSRLELAMRHRLTPKGEESGRRAEDREPFRRVSSR